MTADGGVASQVCCAVVALTLALLACPLSPCPPLPSSPALLPCPPPPEQKCEDRFAKSKLVHSIMRHVAETTGCNLEQLYAEVAWPLYRLYGHAYNAFATMVTDAEADAVFKRLADEAHGGAPPPIMSAAVRDGILNNIR